MSARLGASRPDRVGSQKTPGSLAGLTPRGAFFVQPGNSVRVISSGQMDKWTSGQARGRCIGTKPGAFREGCGQSGQARSSAPSNTRRATLDAARGCARFHTLENQRRPPVSPPTRTCVYSQFPTWSFSPFWPPEPCTAVQQAATLEAVRRAERAGRASVWPARFSSPLVRQKPRISTPTAYAPELTR